MSNSTIDEMTDDDLMRFTQGKRKAFINHITEEGWPSDTKEQSIMLAALADMDRTALGNKRIGANERQSEADALVARAIGQLTTQFNGRNPFEKEGEGKVPEYQADKLPEADAAPGEMDIGLSDQTYKDMEDRYS